VKQGIKEQALSKGLNTDETIKAYNDHKAIRGRAREKELYLVYFLSERNARQTKYKRREFLGYNNFTTEELFMKNASPKMKRKYLRICVLLREQDIKWASTGVVYDKYGRIEKLVEHRRKRLIKDIVLSLLLTVVMTIFVSELIATFTFDNWVTKMIDLFTYGLVIAITSILGVSGEYEHGRFTIPNNLEEINNIWEEFIRWSIPQWCIDEVEKEKVDMQEIKEEVAENGKREESIDGGTDIQEQQAEVEMVG
jgi:hypothetical protein